jgi:outer membrane protein
MKRYLLLLTFCALNTSYIYAQTKKWTLQECIQYAMQNNLQIKQRQLTQESASITLKQSKAERLPNLGASVAHNYNIGRSIDPFTNQVVENQLVRSNNFGLNGSWNLFSGFQVKETIERNQLQMQVNELDLQTTQNDIALQVASAYLQILLNAELIKSAEVQLNSTDLQIERTERLVSAGILPELNVLELRGQRANEELTKINAENAYERSKLQLLLLLQLTDLNNFDVATIELNVNGEAAIQDSPEKIYATAESTLPQIKAAQERISVSEKNIRIARAGVYPTLSLGAGVFTNYSSLATRVRNVNFTEQRVFTNDPNIFIVTAQPRAELESFPFFPQLENNLRYGVQFSLSIPIYSNLRIKSNIATNTIQREQVKIQSEQIRNQLRQEVLNAYFDAQAAAKSYNAGVLQVQALRASFDAAEKRYNAGAMNILDYNLSKNNLQRAEINLIRAKYEYVFRQKVLDFYQGKPIDL